MVGYVALGLAYLAAGGAADAGSGYGLVASASAVAVVGAMHAAVRLVRLTSWGLSASLVGFTADAGFGSFGLWHLALTAAVAATVLAAAALDLPGLMWIGAADGVFWICTVAAAAGQSAGWALAVMLAGAGLVGLAALIARLRPTVTPRHARL